MPKLKNLKMKAKKVFTPGSGPQKKPSTSGHKLSPGRGRPRKTKAPNRSRKGNYRHKYVSENLDKALAEVKAGRLSIRAAAKEFEVPKSTILDRLHGVTKNVGRPTELSEEEEQVLVSRLMIMGNWGFPLTFDDM